MRQHLRFLQAQQHTEVSPDEDNANEITYERRTVGQNRTFFYDLFSGGSDGTSNRDVEGNSGNCPGQTSRSWNCPTMFWTELAAASFAWCCNRSPSSRKTRARQCAGLVFLGGRCAHVARLRDRAPQALARPRVGRCTPFPGKAVPGPSPARAARVEPMTARPRRSESI
jgi:hypothetical protein